jgi:hypothetical protein
VVVVAVFGLVLVVVEVPNTKPPLPVPVVVVVPVAIWIVPVHVAPMGQHAIFLAWSRVHIDPDVQQAPASAFAKVEQEL